jgi:hypothetical protein
MGKVTNIEDRMNKRDEEDYPDTLEIFSVDVDTETGEAEIDWFPEYDTLSPLMQMDVLQDVLNEVSARYEKAVHEFGGTH